MQLGATTDTQDAEGQVVDEKDWCGVTKECLNRVISGFVGKGEQLPPMYSALKKDGQPLYKLARKGVEVERKSRSITIASMIIDKVRLPYVTFTVKCSKGTYVRTICHDIGLRLGCGAHMTALRRLSCGSFKIDTAHSLEELQSLVEQGRRLPLISLSAVLADWPALEITKVRLCKN